MAMYFIITVMYINVVMQATHHKDSLVLHTHIDIQPLSIHIYIHTCTHACAPTNTHTHTHTHIHTLKTILGSCCFTEQ